MTKIYLGIMKPQLGRVIRVATHLLVNRHNMENADESEMEWHLFPQNLNFDDLISDNIVHEDSRTETLANVGEDYSYSPENQISKEIQHFCIHEIHRYLQQLDDRSWDILQSRWLEDGDNESALDALAKKYKLTYEQFVKSKTLHSFNYDNTLQSGVLKRQTKYSTINRVRVGVTTRYENSKHRGELGNLPNSPIRYFFKRSSVPANASVA